MKLLMEIIHGGLSEEIDNREQAACAGWLQVLLQVVTAVHRRDWTGHG